MFINKSGLDKKLKNNVLGLSQAARKAKELDPETINATSGMLFDEDGSLYVFKSVEKALNDLSPLDKYSYQSISGNPNFTQAILKWVFGSYLDEVLQKQNAGVIPAAGGSGALCLVFSNYVNKGETVLFPNYMWENYMVYASEMGFVGDTYSLFAGNEFDLESVKKKINGIKNKQKRIIILFNDPCENPTGFCMKQQDYDSLLGIVKDNPNNDFIFIMDMAYFDFYNVNPDVIRGRYASLASDLNNLMTFFSFSGSKSFGLYGIRIGALLALAKEQEEIDNFLDASAYSSRARWSAASTLGTNLISTMILNERYNSLFKEEVKLVCQMLEDRALAFINEAKRVGLHTIPYERGFFVSIPCKNPEALMKALWEDKVHIVVSGDTVRVALSAINKSESSRLPQIIKNRMDEMEKKI